MNIVTKSKGAGKVVRLSEDLWEAVAIAATYSRTTIHRIVDSAVQDWLKKRKRDGK